MNIQELESLKGKCPRCQKDTMLLPYGVEDSLICFFCGMEHYRDKVSAFALDGLQQTLRIDYPDMSEDELQRTAARKHKVIMQTLDEIYQHRERSENEN